MFQKISFLIFLVFTLEAFSGTVSKKNQVPNWNSEKAVEADSYLNKYLAEMKLPGLAVVIIVNGETVFSNGYGVQSVESGDPVGQNTFFHMASVSKTFVSMGVLKLVHEGLVNLDNPIKEYLPHFTVNDPRAIEITVRQLLSHTSGMPDTNYYGWERPNLRESALREYVSGLGGLKLLTTPGEIYSYSNIGFEILGALISEVSGKPFEAYMKKEVLEPFGLQESSFLKTDLNAEKLSLPHIGPGEPILSQVYPYNREHSPSSTFHTNLKEAAIWAKNLLAFQYQEKDQNWKTNLKEMWDPQFQRGTSRHVGLGWFILDRDQGRFFYHSGSDIGFSSFAFFFPENKTAVIVMSNHERSKAADLANRLIKFTYDDNALKKYSNIAPISLVMESTRTEEGIASAIRLYETLKIENPEEYKYGAGVLLDYAHDLDAMGENQDAILVMYQVQKEEPDHFLTYRELARLLLNGNQTKVALENILKAIEINPEDNESHLIKGQIEDRLDQSTDQKP